jgi:peptidoglycan/LPS O-acetylase OafA/YrhL
VRRLDGIEGVRGLAAASVVLFHVWYYTPPFRDGPAGAIGAPLLGRLWIGVIAFFVLSGFLLYRPFLGDEPPSLARYARSRALRIVPAYYLALTVLLVAFHRDLLTGPAWGWLKQYLFLQIYFPDSTRVVIGPAWTLCIEVTFYAALPLLALWRRPWALVATLFALGLGYQTATLMHPLPLALPQFLDLFAVGMGLAILHARGVLVDGRRLVLAGLALTALALPFARTTAIATDLRSLAFDPLVALAFACFLGALVLSTHVAPRRVLCSPAIVWLGSVSYGLYLWHEPLLQKLYWRLLLRFPIDEVPRWEWPMIPMVVAAAVAAAAASWYFVERRALALKVYGGGRIRTSVG